MTKDTILGEMVADIVGEFNKVEHSTIQSNKISENALDKGNLLISSSDQMMTLSVESKQAVQEVEHLIDALESSLKKRL